MKPFDRTKPCSQCEADVSVQATYCPFCGTDLFSQKSEDQVEEKQSPSTHQAQESLASLYKPPYSMRSRQGVGVPDEREEPTFVRAEPIKEDPLFQSYGAHKDTGEGDVKQEGEPPSEQRGTLWPLLLLSMGGCLFALGALILLCSKEGVLTLEWKSRYWLVYWLMSLPLLILGVRRLKVT